MQLKTWLADDTIRSSCLLLHSRFDPQSCRFAVFTLASHHQLCCAPPAGVFDPKQLPALVMLPSGRSNASQQQRARILRSECCNFQHGCARGVQQQNISWNFAVAPGHHRMLAACCDCRCVSCTCPGASACCRVAAIMPFDRRKNWQNQALVEALCTFSVC